MKPKHKQRIWFIFLLLGLILFFFTGCYCIKTVEYRPVECRTVEYRMVEYEYKIPSPEERAKASAIKLKELYEKKKK